MKPDFPRITCIIPCWMRPQRTERAIRSVLAQTILEWELIVVGDCCPVLPEVWRKVFGRGLDGSIILENDGLAKVKGCNLETHEGKFGTQCLNWGLTWTTGQYVCFLGNDDYVAPNHFELRLKSIEGTDYGFAYHDALIQDGQVMRRRPGHPLAHGQTGGSELIVKTQLAQKVGFTSGDYGHDWTFIRGLIEQGVKSAYFPSATYVVTHLPNQICEKDID